MARSLGRPRRHGFAAWGFTAPYLILLTVFGIIPAGYAVYESLRPAPSYTGESNGSLGISNYRSVLNDFRFWPAVEDVATFMAIWIPVMVVGALLFALLLHEKVGRFSSVMRLIYFLPGAVTGSAAVLLWYFMLDPQLSPFRAELHAMGFANGNDMFATGHLAPIFAVIVFTTGVGQWIVIMFGALQSVPHDVLEAARIDGAGAVRIALFIKLPLISKYITYMIILCFAAALQIFVEPSLFYSITNAGSRWWSLNQLGYYFATQQGQFAEAATISVVLLIVSSVVALIFVLRSSLFAIEVDE